jgi:hypothetical protein
MAEEFLPRKLREEPIAIEETREVSPEPVDPG